MFGKDKNLDIDVIRILTSITLELHPDIRKMDEKPKLSLGAEVLKVAYVFDQMTAMNFEEEPFSEIAAIRHLMDSPDEYNRTVVDALINSINILQAGKCIELTNGDKGLVITANDNNILEPFVLSFRDNVVYNLGDSRVAKEVQIKDIMKTMDNRNVIDKDMFSQYKGKPVREVNTQI